MNNTSILTSIKKLLGITEEQTDFDTDIIIHINSVFAVLTKQLGVGPVGGFRIQDEYAVWDDFDSDEELVDLIKTYIYLKVKLIFDPPLSSAVMSSMKEMISEHEWRLNTYVESIKSE